MKGKRGITLVSLVITIIILLILAGLSISATITEGGILLRTEEGKFKTEVSQILELLNVKVIEEKIEDTNFNTATMHGKIDIILKDTSRYTSYIDKLYVYKGQLAYVGNIRREIKWAEELGLKIVDMTSEENKLSVLIDKDKNEAVRKNQITKNQYTYRIEGDTKAAIEEKLGRKLDYSIDRFYEVKYKNILPEIEEGKTFIYSDTSGIVVEVKEKTEKNIATWFWNDDSDLDIAIMKQQHSQNQFFERLENFNISQIYICEAFDEIVGNVDLENFVAKAYENNIKCYIVTGEKNYLDSDLKQESIYTLYDIVEKYNSLVDYNKRLAGVSYDAEVWLNSEYNWKTNEEIRKQHIQYIKETKKYADTKNLEAIFTLPFWLIQFNYTDNNGNVINMYDEATTILDEVNLMLYRDSAEKIDKLVTTIQENAEKTLLEYIEENSCTLNIGVELDPSLEGDNITFYEEELARQGYLMEEILKLDDMYRDNWNNYIFSIHHTQPLIELSGGIDIQEPVKIGTPEQLIAFLNRTGDSSGERFEIINNINMQGYTVSAYANSEDGFNGILDGKNFAIENLVMESDEYTGLFELIGVNGIVKNLNIKNSTITSTTYFAGAIAGVNYGTILNCSNQNTTVTAQRFAGGITGRNYGIVKNSFNTGNITTRDFYVGGITGKNETNAEIFNVYNIGLITENGADGAKGAIAGENIGTVQKAYWLETSAENALGYLTEGETIKLTDEEMTTANFATTLNSNISGNKDLKQWKMENGEYPHF